MKSSDILKANEAQIRRMLASNVTLQEIGNHYGVTKHVVRHWAEKLGIKRSRVRPRPSASRQLLEKHWPRISKMLTDGYNYRQIAEDIGVSRGVILGWSKRWPRPHRPAIVGAETKPAPSPA